MVARKTKVPLAKIILLVSVLILVIYSRSCIKRKFLHNEQIKIINKK